MAELAIEVSDLHKSYGPTQAVRGVSFGVERGEVFGLLGPNGAGKTTTVEILEGYRKRSAGEVRVLGHDPEVRNRRLQERVGIVLQSCGFYPRVTVREAVDHFAKAYPRPRDPAETIGLVGLTDKADARTNELSGGQRRRLDLALALVGDPELVFLDEPTTGFDPAARRTAWNAVRRAQGPRQDGGAHHPLPGRGAGAGGPRGDREGRPHRGRGPAGGARPGDSYRVCYLSAGRRVEHRDRRPDRAAAPPNARRARARRAARGAGGRPADARGGLSGADARRRPSDERDGPRLGAVPARAQALLAQPERRVLQLHPAAAAAGPDRVGVRRATPTSSRCSCRASPA